MPNRLPPKERKSPRGSPSLQGRHRLPASQQLANIRRDAETNAPRIVALLDHEHGGFGDPEFKQLEKEIKIQWLPAKV